MGWTWGYLHHGIAWATVQRIMSDLPSYDFKDKEESSGINLSRDNAEDVMNFINKMT